ncbi:DUF262 domain-containing HNH endonuclease family protein [Acinetobacter lwoffii]|uniref:DUF262 domain-containing protein n=1 Tax=Acinetobacter lwoffii TaxID=28090 RepID=UPI001C218BB1|nr:DUF262 domain-containing protein [Acinetobacter lwoffii]QXB84702.1 DUF262 domain-containing HNH endonuclease family protein [Acinetobacter lwoffii]
MSKKISGAEYPLAKIFSSDFQYVIPSYQRPYTWEEQHASVLFDDLYNFFQTEKEDEYFLGSIVLIKQEGKPYAEVIDGQQRLTTLTILFAVFAALDQGGINSQLYKYIFEPGNEFEGINPQPRLTLRERDKDYFKKYVQELNFEALFKLDNEQLENEAKLHIKQNSKVLYDKVKTTFDHDAQSLKEFIKFLVQRCFIVAVTTPSQNTAFRVFSVMNSRGLDLQPTDIIKADVIGALSAETDREVYSKKWEDLEESIGREDFNNLFSHIRMIFSKEKAKRNLLEEFKGYVLSIITDPKVFVDQILDPYVDAYDIVKTSSYTATANAEKINNHLKWLNRIDNSDWVPAAIQFVIQNKSDSEYMLWFFEKLERLAAYMHICGLNINERIERYKLVLLALEQEHSLAAPVSTVELSNDEKIQMLNVLQSDIYSLTARRRNHIILRLDSFLSDGAATYDSSILTIEHVLPQTVHEGSEWSNLWPDEDVRKAWTHKLANLVPLNKRRNSKAQNYDFDKKKTAYFAGTKAVSSYVLTTQVLNEPQWTPDVILKRQDALLNVFK